MQPYERTSLWLEQLKRSASKNAADEAVRLKAIAFVAKQLDDQIRRARANGDLV